jgi:hypothetical protein
MYFAAGSIRIKAHGYLYDSSSLPHRKGKLAKRSLAYSDYERIVAEASRGY